MAEFAIFTKASYQQNHKSDLHIHHIKLPQDIGRSFKSKLSNTTSLQTVKVNLKNALTRWFLISNTSDLIVRTKLFADVLMKYRMVH